MNCTICNQPFPASELMGEVKVCQICDGTLTGEDEQTLDLLIDRYEAIINEEQGSPWRAFNQAFIDMVATTSKGGRHTIHKAISVFI